MSKRPEGYMSLADASHQISAGLREIGRLKEINADLLDALKWAESALAPFSKEPAEKSGMAMIRRAIAKAEFTASDGAQLACED